MQNNNIAFVVKFWTGKNVFSKTAVNILFLYALETLLSIMFYFLKKSLLAAFFSYSPEIKIIVQMCFGVH